MNHLNRCAALAVTSFLVLSCGDTEVRGQPKPDARPKDAPAAPQAAGHKHTNRLAREKSPYLLQHAHNPVDWFPWGDEAFAKAKKENKPVFLSVGYSTCHWCHVMERESFESEEVAKLLNEWFVPVKVDREERPDIDRIYMTFVQATTGSGGWPMTVFLTPDRKPFVGGTYFPPEDRGGRPGIKTVLARVHELWTEDPKKIAANADRLAAGLGEITRVRPDPAAAADAALLDAGARRLLARVDEENGGFGTAPKFPEPPGLAYLLRYAHRSGNVEPREAVLKALRSMAAGGIYDHLGGGFHRYSTDARWFLPHFEKMLYDQAQLAGVYLDAYQFTGDAAYADTARDVFAYVLRDMTGPQGQFYSAEDADSALDPDKPREKTEGAFYVWSEAEVASVLGKEAAAVFGYHYGVEPGGNVKHDPHGEFGGLNVLFVAHTPEQTAAKFGKPVEEIDRLLADARRKLADARSARPRPYRDDKAIVAWNGLMISALARGGPTLGEPRYTAAAAKAAGFVRDHLYDPKTHTLKRLWRDGATDVDGFLEDYAFFVQGLLDLYESTLDVQWLRLAVALQAKQDELFADREGGGGGYFSTAAGAPGVLLRVIDDNEGAEPSANSVAAMNLLRLSQMLDDEPMRKSADATLRLFAGRMKEHPGSMPFMLSALSFGLSKPKQIVLAGDPASPDMGAMLATVFGRYLPDRVVLAADTGPGQAFLADRVEFIKTVKPLGGRATAYVCENYTCREPTNDPAAVARLLAGAVERPQAGGPQNRPEDTPK